MVSRVKKNNAFSMTSHVMAGVFFIHAILLPIFYIMIIEIYKDNVAEQFVGYVREVTGLVSDVIIADQTSDNIELVMETALLGGELLYIELVDGNGKQITVDDNITMITSPFVEDTFIDQNGDEIYFISVPLKVHLAGDVYTELRLGFDEAVVMDRLFVVKQRSLVILVVYFIGIIILLGYLTSRLMRPLKALREWSRSVAAGETMTDVVITSNITEVRDLSDDLECMRLSLVELAEHMHHKAMHDELTALPNRTLNNDRINSAIARSFRAKSSFAVLLLDLDRFKDINDTLGHGVGDEVLMVVADRFKSGVRDSDSIARIGGDEFCAIFEGVECVVAEKLALNLIALLEAPMMVNGHTLQIGASAGIAVYPENGSSPELLLQHADVAMYEAKYQGLQVVSYHEDMDKHRVEDLQLSTDLKEGIKLDQFFAVFQPKINLETGLPCGCELLARWNHPQFGIISPDKFIPIAERDNMIFNMTRNIFDKYVSQMKSLVDTYPGFKVSINVSPLNLLDTSLLDGLEIIMQNNDFDASNLIIEVTENAIMTNPVRSASILQKFSDAGIEVSVDDFGTGYSSLAYLQKFPIDELKIDKSFIIGLTKKSQNYPIVNATITMAHDLGMTVIAEGVEEKSVVGLLEELHCDRLQGVYFSEPISYTDLRMWLDRFETSGKA